MPLAPLPVAIPLLAAAFIAATHRIVRSRIANWIALASAASTAAICGTLCARSGAAQIVYWFGGWQPRGGMAVGISFAIDRAGAGLAALAAALVLAGLIFSSKYFDVAHALYQVLMLAFLAALCGFCLTGDLFNLFVFFELMSAAAFALCGFKTEDPGPLQGALNFAITNTLGAFLALSGIGLLYGRTGALNMAQIGRALGTRADGLVIVAFVFIMCGFLVKGAIVPFHFWLADAHAVAPTPVCVLFSGIMVELGLYAVARVYWTMFSNPLASHANELRGALVGVGALSAILGGVMCFAQRHVKRLLAYSTISHMGLMLMGFALLSRDGLAGTGLYMFGHAMVKSPLFLCAGILLHRFATVDEIELQGRHWRQQRALALTACVWALAGLGLAGMPPFATYLGDGLMADSLGKLGLRWLSLAIPAAEILTGGAVLRAGGRIFAGWGRGAGNGEQLQERQETHAAHGHVPPSMLIPAVALLFAGLALGLAPTIRGAALHSAALFIDRAGYEARVLAGAMPAAPPVPAEAPLGSALIHGFASALGAMALAAASLRGWRLRGGLERSLALLHRIHSGEVGDYVAWLTGGVAVFGALFLALLR